MLCHEALIADVNACALSEREYAFWWLGQQGFILKMGTKVIYIDPFLSGLPDRLIPSLLDPAEVTNADLILGSHDHADHIDRIAWPNIAAAVPDTRFIVPELLKDDLACGLNIDSELFIGMDDGLQKEVDGVEITGIAAAHELLDRDKTSGHYPYLGYIINANGVTIYHAGDTCMYEGLITKLKHWKLDAMFVPINGRDAVRLAAGCIGNMTYQEAVDLAGALSPGLTIPAHYGMFSSNTADPQLFVDYMRVKYGTLRVCLCEPGKQYMIIKETEALAQPVALSEAS
jgi:L-ascorbate 6-phosphate lactonase